MENNLFDINNFNTIQDEENYYFFRALNMGDNSDIEQRATISLDGKIERIRTDRERVNGQTKYTKDSKISLEEMYDHIKMNHRQDTNCISITSNANIAVDYGRGYYKDKYVMIKIPKKEFGENTVVAGQYMLQKLYSRIEQEISDLPNKQKQKILDIFTQIENAKENKVLQNIITNRYITKNGIINPDKGNLRKGIKYSLPKTRISNYQLLDERQLLEVNKVYAKLAILENEHILEHVISHSSNSKLRETIGNAFSSAEVIHYGDIEQKKILEVPKEIVDIFALIQQVNGIDKNELEDIKQALIKVIQDGKTIPQIPEINSQVKDDISIEEMYELTGGKIEYGKANDIVKNMFYLSKSRQNAIVLSNVLLQVLGNNPKYANVIQYIRENGFRIEPEIISRQSGKGVKLSETVNLDLKQEEQMLVDEIKKLSSEELGTVIQNGGLHNVGDIITKTFSNVKENIKIDKSRYYAEAIINNYNWKDIGIEGFREEEKEKLIQKLQKRNCVQIYKELEQFGIEKSELSTVLLNIVTREGFYEQYEQGNLNQLLSTKQETLQNNINIEVIEGFLDYYNVENTKIRLKDYQQRAYDNVNQIFENKKFAQVILPTGAGKSFVALAQMQKYIQEHLNEKILYLAPQEEILNQIKRYILKYIHGEKGTVGKSEDEIMAEIFPNIVFETYSGLLSKRGKNIIQDQYGMIVLDELHRTGAKEWQGKVDRLLVNQTDDVKVLGITATPTRDVDSKNMADEIAKKLGYSEEEIKQTQHIASNMTLKNAIRMGYIVNPKLICCKYDLISSGKMESLKRKLNSIENKNEREKELQKLKKLQENLNREIDNEIGKDARKQLEESARKNLDSGIGKEDIIRQNIKKGKKYIVFIPVSDQGDIEDEEGNRIGTKNGENKVKSYQDYLSKIFEGTDITPQLYSLLGSYSKNKNKSELEKFQIDNEEETKFMIVMNKANEGLHIDGINGIIWFRALDKNSKTLYLQQLGRALYALDENNPVSDDERPTIIDLANNSLTVKMEKDFKNTESIDDFEALTIVIEWVEQHNGILPDGDSSNRREQHYYNVLRTIQKKYSKYLGGFNNFKNLTDEEKTRIEEIIELASEIDLWNIFLPPSLKLEENKEQINPFKMTGVIKDFVEMDENIDTINKIDNLEITKQYIQFLKTYGKKPSSQFRENGMEISRISQMTVEQKYEKRLYSRWNESLTRKLLEKKLKNPTEEIEPEYSEVIDEIKELILEIESKENINKVQDYIEFLEKYHKRPQLCFRKKGKQLTADQLTDEQRYQKNLRLRWKISEVKRILDEYMDKTIDEVPKYYRNVIAKLRGLGELGEKIEERKAIKREKTTEEEYLEFLNENNKTPLSAIKKNGKTLTIKEMNEKEREEVNLAKRWNMCPVRKYMEMELPKVPEEYRNITSAISQKISNLSLNSEAEVAIEYVRFLETNMRTPLNTIWKNGRKFNISELTDIEREEVNLADHYRKSKIARTFKKFENGEIDDLPKMWMDIYKKRTVLLEKIDIIEKTKIAKEYIEFIEKNSRLPRYHTTGRRRLKRTLKTEEQAYEESLAGRWGNSYIKTALDKYIKNPDEGMPIEFKEIMSKLIELGYGSIKSNLNEAKKQRDDAKVKNEKAKELERQVEAQLEKRGNKYEK